MPSYQVIIPNNLTPDPKEHEISAAKIAASYFQADVMFIPRTHCYTADYLIKNENWEHKSPTGNGKRTIENNLREALKQSGNIIFDARRLKINQAKVERDLLFLYRKNRRIQRLILITKSGKVIELHR